MGDVSFLCGFYETIEMSNFVPLEEKIPSPVEVSSSQDEDPQVPRSCAIK